MTPQRIQLRRTKGWRKPEGAIVVARPSKWGNPFRIQKNMGKIRIGYGDDARFVSSWHVVGPRNQTCRAYVTSEAVASKHAVTLFKKSLTPADHRRIREALKGHDLACWCPLEDGDGNRVPCHADVLLQLANPEVLFSWM